MTLLALETSCDETSAAVVRDGKMLANVVSSQIKLHAEYGGVVPELAAREHLKNLLPVAQAALREAGVSAAQLDAVAATQGPGLAIALLIGFKAAQAVAFALNKPFIGINHHEAHLYSPWIVPAAPATRRRTFAKFQPNVSLIVSGGHTLLVLVESELNHRVLGGTIDDAAGECFDKTGKLMGLPYPAGPVIDRLAEQGNPPAFDFPAPAAARCQRRFQFQRPENFRALFHPRPSGAARRPAKSPRPLRQRAGGDRRGAGEENHPRGAARRCPLRDRVRRRDLQPRPAPRAGAGLPAKGFTLRLAEKSLCTDNAAMIGILAERKLLAACRCRRSTRRSSPAGRWRERFVQ